MANLSLIELKEAFTHAREELLDADKTREVAAEKLALAEGEFDGAEAALKGAHKRLTSYEAKLAKLEAKFVKAQTDYADANDLAKEAAKKLKKAQDDLAAGKKLPKGAPRLATLQRRAKAAQEKADELGQVVKALEHDVGDMKVLVEKLDRLYQKALHAENTAEANLLSVKAEYDHIERDWEAKTGERDTLMEKVQSAQITGASLSKEWNKLSELQKVSRPPRYLKINTPQVEMDPYIREILSAMAEKGGKPEDKLRKLRALIEKYGIATEVAKVTSYLNRRNIPELSRFVLAATYYSTLTYQIKKAARGGKKAVVTEFEDTLGVVEAIRIRQQNPDKGALIGFAIKLVDAVAVRRSLNLSKYQKSVLAGQIQEMTQY